MGVAYQQCEEYLDQAVAQLFAADAQIQAVGIARHEDAFGFKAVKNTERIVKASAAVAAKHKAASLKSIKNVPVIIDEASADIEAHLKVPHPLVASQIPERKQHKTLVCGLQIQNVD